MMDYDNDEVIAEITDEMYQREHQQKNSKLSGIDKTAKVWIGVFVGVVFFCMFTEKITNLTGIKMLVVGVLIIYFVCVKDSNRGVELSYVECMIRLTETLKMLQKHKIGDLEQVPPGQIGVMLVGRKQWYEGQSFKRSFGVKIRNQFKNTINIYFVEVDIFTGDIITFREAREGVRGDETKDIKIMAGYDMMVQKKRDQYLNKNYKI